MACEGNGMSDERIGEALIKEVIQEELKEVTSQDVPDLTPPDVQTVLEQKIVTQVHKAMRKIGDSLKGNKELHDAVDGMVRSPGSKWDIFKKVADKLFNDGITWEKIAVLFYAAGKMAAKMVEAHLPQSVRDILMWTVDFFRNNLLGWILEHGGWINSFSDLAQASVQNVSSLSSHSYGLALIFVAGLAIGSFITWRLTRQP